MSTSRWVIGLASGASGDGVDAAFLELDGIGHELRVRPIQALAYPYPADLRELLGHVGEATDAATLRDVGLLHRLLGESFAAAARQVADRVSLNLGKVQCIGCSGHTVVHDPEGRFSATLALGMPAVIAERTGLTVVSDFRSRDLAAGGNGSPLTALVDHLLFRHPQESRLLIHLGGVARVVHLPGGGKSSEIISFEAAPCNVLLDALMQQLSGGKEPYDWGGKHAVQGQCVETLLQHWLAHPALQQVPPRYLPRQLFGSAFATAAVDEVRQHEISMHDLLCTATHFVARGVATAVRQFLPEGRRIDRVMLSGGGARNGLLLALLGHAFGETPVTRTDALGLPADARNSLGFGVLAALTLDGVAASISSVTGAVASRLLGTITPGASANWARCLAWMSTQTAPLLRVDQLVS